MKMQQIIAGPFNEVTRNEYKGGNIDILAIAQEEFEYDSNRGWAGFHQWLSVGRSVRKGEKGTRIAKFIDIIDEKTQQEKKVPRTFVIFHYDQTQELVKEAK